MQAAIAEQNIVIANQNDWPDSLQSLIADMRIGMICAYFFCRSWCRCKYLNIIQCGYDGYDICHYCCGLRLLKGHQQKNQLSPEAWQQGFNDMRVYRTVAIALIAFCLLATP